MFQKQSTLTVIDLYVDEHILCEEFDKLPLDQQAALMIEGLINAGYRMHSIPTEENLNKWRALVHKWRGRP